MKKIFVLLGLPGSGKGTQAKMLSQYLNLPHVSTGNIFRKMTTSDAPVAKTLNEYMNSGNLVPSNIVNDLVINVLEAEEYKDGCIVDGYPRTAEQAEFLNKHIDAQIVAIYFDIDEKLLEKRILGRYICGDCNATYNKFCMNTVIKDVCDHCGGGNFISRNDDDLDTLQSRINVYKKESAPLLTYYKALNNLIVINANLSKHEISDNLRHATDNILKK